jgi:hypothetical protein
MYDGKRESGLFYSSVLSQQTTTDGPGVKLPREKRLTKSQLDFDRYAERRMLDPIPADDVETSFRHGRWSEGREKVIDALTAANVPASRLERFKCCGGGCVVEFSPSLGKHRVRANYCGDRFCEPCVKARSLRVRKSLLEWTQGETVRFLTLTLRGTDQPLQAVLSRLLSCFVKLREWKFWQSGVRAGAAVVEITRGGKGDHWHVHLHALLIGQWIDQRQLSDAWKKVTGDSSIVDIRPIRSNKDGVEYIAKYATKGWTWAILENPEWLLECIIALRGRRLFLTFGEWYGRQQILCKAGPADWKVVGRIGVIFAAAVAGEEWARAVFRSLGFAPGVAAGRPFFVGAEPPWSGP